MLLSHPLVPLTAHLPWWMFIKLKKSRQGIFSCCLWIEKENISSSSPLPVLELPKLTDYLESSLAYFSQYGYRKTFKLNDARTEVLTIDGTNPTPREGYQLAIIASITVDPENISIQTKDFRVSAANEKHSKIELISNAMQQFTNWYGSLDFEEDYREDVN